MLYSLVPVLVSLQRRSDGLFAVRIRRALISCPPTQPLKEGTDAELETRDPYAELVEPLAGLPEARIEPWKSVLESWEELGRVRRLDGATMGHLIHVLLHTLPEGSGASAPLALPAEPEVRKPTAANPRGLKGAKPKQPRPIDLRPHLTNPRDVNELIERLAPFREEGLDLPALVEAMGRASTLPPPFRRTLLFHQRRLPWPRVLRVLALYRTLDLERREPLRRCVTRLLAHPMSGWALDWAEQIAAQPEDRRTAFAELVVETGVSARPVPEALPAILVRACDLASDGVYRHHMHVLLTSVLQGGDPGYLLAGMELAHAYHPGSHFKVEKESGPVPVERIRMLTGHTAGYLAMVLWEACGKLEQFDRILLDLPWLELAHDAARRLLILPMNIVYETEPGPERQAKWIALRPWMAEILKCMRSIPDAYHEKACRHLDRVVWYWDSPENLDWAMRQYLELLPRICRPPFEESGYDDKVLTPLTSLAFKDWDRIRDGPDSMFRAIERESRRNNDAQLLYRGLRFLTLEESGRVADGLLDEPTAVLKTAGRLGALSSADRARALQQWRAHPLMHDLIGELPTEKLIALVKKHLPEEILLPIPRKLKEHLAGRGAMTPEQVRRARRVVVDALSGVRLRLLGHVCVEQAARGLRPRSGAAKVVHAVRLYAQIEDNRPALRKFLQAHFKGDQDYLRRHPLNQAWLRRQKRLNVPAWLEGMEQEATLEDGTAVRLHIELDPLEALRLGTYVGSCTGLGGTNSYSAAAFVLDLNKRVVYARNREGAVLGRQLLAVTDEEDLMVFSVYPVGASREMQKLFQQFDRDLAARLGVRIYKPTYTGSVETLLSRFWYDDDAWDITPERV
jgi:hypothetical protein